MYFHLILYPHFPLLQINFSYINHTHSLSVYCVCMMGSEGNQQSSIPRLPLFSAPPAKQMKSSPERSGTVTPPLQTSGSVPFRWEQEPGKPKLCNALVTYINPADKSLELPPRLLVVPSPNLLQQGPCVTSNRFRSPSFRIEDNTKCYGSSGAKNILSWRKNVKRDSGGSHVFPSSTGIAETRVTHNNNKMIRSGSSSSHPHHDKSRVWVKLQLFLHSMFQLSWNCICNCYIIIITMHLQRTVREGMKQVVTLQWRNKKLNKKKDGSSLKHWDLVGWLKLTTTSVLYYSRRHSTTSLFCCITTVKKSVWG